MLPERGDGHAPASAAKRKQDGGGRGGVKEKRGSKIGNTRPHKLPEAATRQGWEPQAPPRPETPSARARHKASGHRNERRRGQKGEASVARAAAAANANMAMEKGAKCRRHEALHVRSHRRRRCPLHCEICSSVGGSGRPVRLLAPSLSLCTNVGTSPRWKRTTETKLAVPPMPAESSSERRQPVWERSARHALVRGTCGMAGNDLFEIACARLMLCAVFARFKLRVTTSAELPGMT